MATEVELKLAFPGNALAAVEAHPLIAGSPREGNDETLENTYFDTPTLELFAEKIAVRTRKAGKRWLQTVKCAATSVGGLSSRPEWEQPYKDQFDFAAVDAEKVRKFLESRQPRLLPLFSTVFHRQTRRVEPRPGVVILLMLDVGKVVSAQGEAPISELELELVSGAPADLQDFALSLAADLPLIPFDRSKAERGYRLFRKTAEKPVKAGKTPAQPEMTPREAFRAIALQGQQIWQANLFGALNSDDPEYIHQFRVSLRKLNTLVRVFEPVIGDSFYGTWADQLKSLAATSGQARDLDVMRDEILQPLLCSEGDASHHQHVNHALAAVAAARSRAGEHFDRQRHGPPLLSFVRDLEHLPNPPTAPRIGDFAEARLARLHRKAAKRLATTVRKPTPENAHRFRISLKHLRYTCEFFAPLFDEVPMTAFAREVASLQDEFGFINDLYVALQRLDSWSADDPALKDARDHIARWYGGRLDQSLASGLDAASTVLGQCLPWCGECDRRQIEGIRKRIKQGITVRID